MPALDQKFVAEMLQLGILSFPEQETLWSIAQRCARTAGIPMAGFGFVALANVGTVMVPGVGALPGAVAGALAGLAGGTISCVMLNTTMRDQLRQLARGG
jgi:hypothetical protein